VTEYFKIIPGADTDSYIIIIKTPKKARTYKIKDYHELLICLEHWTCPIQKMKHHPMKYSDTNKNCPICVESFADKEKVNP
jgi:hypothetical protein